MRKMTAAVVGAAALMAGGAAAAPLPKPRRFAMCGVCHKIVKDAPKALGPNLWGVGGRTSGTLAGFNYSPAMKNARLQWNRPSLIALDRKSTRLNSSH